MKKYTYYIPALLWMGVIFYSSSQPYEDQDLKPTLAKYLDLTFLEPIFDHVSFVYHQSEVSIASLGIGGFIEFFIRKGAHVTVFLILCLLLYYAFTRTIASSRMAVLFAFFSTILYAIFDEWHQGWTPNRTPYIGDIFLDGIGAIIAVLIIFILRIIQHRTKIMH